eukprot:6236442-Prymnesium_polylepis.1
MSDEGACGGGADGKGATEGASGEADALSHRPPAANKFSHTPEDAAANGGGDGVPANVEQRL